MRRKYKKILILFCLLVLATSALLAQESLSKMIRVRFTSLNCQSTYEDWNTLITDYAQYGLKFVFWYGPLGNTPCSAAVLIYHTSTIEMDVLLDILMSDYRVEITHEYENDHFRVRQLIITLYHTEDEEEFKNSYSQYGLNGSSPINYLDPYKRLYSFNDTTTYPGDILDILRDDSRVNSAFLKMTGHDGYIHFSLHDWVEEDMIEMFIAEYPYIQFFLHVSPHHWGARFDPILNNEFTLLYQFLSDERVSSASFSDIDGPFLRSCPEPVTLIDETQKEKTKVSAYPNPVMRGTNISFTNNSPFIPSEFNIYNIKGQKVKKAIFKEDTFVWNGRDNNDNQLQSGIYFYQIKTDNEVHTGKILIIN